MTTPNRTTDRRAGTVKTFDDVRGFGFITPDGSRKDLFVHRSAIQGDGPARARGLVPGQRVEFSVVDSDKGPRAEDVGDEE